MEGHLPGAVRMAHPCPQVASFQKQIAITLWKLTTPDSYHSVGNQFGMERSPIGVVIMQVIINTILLHQLILLGDMDHIITVFVTTGFPSCREVEGRALMAPTSPSGLPATGHPTTSTGRDTFLWSCRLSWTTAAASRILTSGGKGRHKMPESSGNPACSEAACWHFFPRPCH